MFSIRHLTAAADSPQTSARQRRRDRKEDRGTRSVALGHPFEIWSRTWPHHS